MPTFNIPDFHSPIKRLHRLMRRRTILAIERYPMVGLFGITATFIALEPWLGTLLSNGLLVVAGVLITYWIASVCIGKRRVPSIWKIAALCSTIAALLVYYQHGTRQRTEQNKALIKAKWESTKSDDAGIAWEPIALRGTIEQSVSLRPSMKPRESPASPQSSSDPLQTDETPTWMSTSVVRVEQIRERQSWEEVSFLAPFSVMGRSELLPGDRVEIYGRWKLPGVATNPGQRDPTEFFTSNGYDFQLRVEAADQIKPWKASEPFRLDRWLSKVRNVAIDSMEANVPLGMSDLACALILGQRDMASWQLQEELLATGTIHMLAISGLHIEMIASALLFLGALMKTPNKRFLLAVCLIVWAYTLLCGANPPVMRAAIMLSLAYIARILGWQFSSLNNLATTALILLIYRPGILFEVGPQLSFIAVAVLILSSENLTKRQTALMSLIKAREGHGMRTYRAVMAWVYSALRTSFWVWIVTLPIVWNGFHVVSPVSIALNLLLWFPTMIALVSGLAMIVVGWVPIVGSILGIFCGVPLWLVDQFVDLGESVPFGHFWGPAPPVAWMYGFYAIALVLMVYSGRRRAFSRNRLLFTLLIWLGIGIAFNPAYKMLHRWSSPEKRLVITFIDVGHGTNAWIQTPDNELWIYDAGRLGDHERSYRRIADALWYEKHATIDRMILSHADSDHYNGFLGLLKRFAIRSFATTPQVLRHDSETLGNLTSSITRRGIGTEVWVKGQSIESSDWSVRTIHPTADLGGVSDNASSLCLMFEFAGRRMLLPGDLEPPGIQNVTKEPKITVDLIMAPHHGSLNAKSRLLVDWCDPKVIMISCSDRVNTKKVLQYFEGKDRDVLLTSRDHALRAIVSSDGRMTIQTWQDDGWETTKYLDR
ncbi:MAG: ComEC/Rec2 family competence protein [Pirellula sp.]|nr:ComEC/Rec2 family competence protein [Pirellula sp.]